MNGFSIPFTALILAAFLFVLGVLHRRDGSARKKIARLNRMNEELARELASLELLKSKLLSRVGEALSLPLHRASEAAEKLRAQGGGLPLEIKASLADLSGEVASILRILGVFEEMASRGEEGPGSGETAQADLDSITTDAVQKAADSASENGVSLAVSLDSGVRVRGSMEHIAEAVDSLFREALRRAARGSLMSVTLTSEHEAARLSISYESGGEGAPESILGTGMARLIATSFGGWLNEDPEKGVLSMSLPLAEDR
jgi:signal transduction histidine kinase